MLWTDGEVSKLLLDFTVSDDYLTDCALLKYDVQGTKAHVGALEKEKILSSEEKNLILKALDELLELEEKDEFKIKKEQEDSHTAIEEFLTKKLGDVGKKIQTGRSRNDQSLTMIRLYSKDQLSRIQDQTIHLIKSIKNKTQPNHPMPGYTHMQKAMPFSTKKWLEAFVESLEGDLHCIQSAYILLDQSPLGSAAGYGSSLDLDRAGEAKDLGFSKVQENTLFCQNSRGKFDLFVLSALQQLSLTMNKLSSDLMLFSTEEFGFITKPKELCTGSSLMPHKKNPDVLELCRAKTNSLTGNYVKIASIIANLPSGYHRDFQETKNPLIESFQIVSSCLQLMALWVEKMEFNSEALNKSMSNDLYSVDKTLEQVKKGVPFRDAYKSLKD